MGILRADRVSGLGGANAINGSVNFVSFNPNNTGDYLRVDRKDNSDFNLSTNDFTMEFWFNSRNVSSTLFPFAFAAPTVSASSDAGFYVRFNGGVVNFNCFEGNNTIGACSTGSVSLNTWYHVAYVRSGSTFTIYLNGTSAATASSSAAVNFDAGWNFNIGSAYTNTYHYNGYVSNLRIVNGTALYTTNFTVPNRLEAVDNTVLLCCQSPGNVLQEASGKTLQLIQSSTANQYAQATRFAPDVGEDHGTTFADNTKFDTLSYMVPPGGTTTESNRGRGLIAGHYNTPQVNTISYINIQSTGNAINFGDLVSGAATAGCFASSTRGVWCGGYYGPGGTVTDTIQYVTIATQGNAIDSTGNLLAARKMNAGLSNDTRGVNAGGTAPSSPDNVMQYVTIASLGNASDFGDLTAVSFYPSAAGNTTRGIIYLGSPAPNTASNVIDYITIATTGNASDFGDATYAAQYRGGLAASSSTRLVNGGGFDAPLNSNVIDYITIATTGNATDFGDLTRPQHGGANMSNSIRGVFAGAYGQSPAQYSNSIEYVTIATTGNASDFGDIPNISGNSSYTAGCSDSHGGIS